MSKEINALDYYGIKIKDGKIADKKMEDKKENLDDMM